MPQYTERSRQLLVDLIWNHTQAIDKIGGRIAKAQLTELPELVAEADVAATNLLSQLRIQNGE